MDDINNTLVKKISLTPPSIGNNRADSERLSDLLKNIVKTDFVEIGLEVLRKIPLLLRKWNYSVRCVLFKDMDKWILVDILDLDSDEKVCGAAVDLGTTRIDLKIVNLETGEEMYGASIDNPQIKAGDDVLSRVYYAATEDGLMELNRLVVGGLNNLIGEACLSVGIKKDDVYIVSVAGNTVMTHLFMKLDPQWITREPYTPVINRPGVLMAKELDIKVSSNAAVFIFPNIGSYFGGDLIAGILFSGIYRAEEIAMLVDVGTNAEVVLGNKEWLLGCAGAAGPALESGAARMGMKAGPGVIDKVWIEHLTDKINIHTIGDERAVGICGSGMIDLVAHLFLSGMVDVNGKFVKSRCGSRLVDIEGVDYFVLVRGCESATGSELTLSQPDLDSTIRSKAAMYAILVTITGTVGLTPNDLDKFYVAGTFGSFIDPESAISIGMIPDMPVSNRMSLGNSSLGGAVMVLKSSDFMDDVDKIRDAITYLELNVNQEFMNNFSAAKFLPHTDISLFPSVKIFEK